MTAEQPLESLVTEVQAWLEEHWDPGLLVRDWWALVAEAGWSKPQFPVEHGGRDLPPKAETIVRRTFDAHGALPPPGGLGHLMAAPTLVAEGSPEQIARYVPSTLRGTVGWCQLFSEPGSGSDMAAATTRAVRDGDHYVVTGQKVWTSQAKESDFGMLLARTDWDAPKHDGLSWIVLPLDQPGVEIRPLREMTGRSYFNEVFFDGALCSVGDVVGGEGAGWRVAQTTLRFEKAGIGPDGTFSMLPHPGPKGGNLDRRAGDAIVGEAVAFPRLDVDDLIELARTRGVAGDAIVRQGIAQLVAMTRTSIWNTRRARAAAGRGEALNMTNLGKVAGHRIALHTTAVANHIAGPAGTLADADGLLDGLFTESTLASAAVRIGGGTDEIQKNVIAERLLGLPREATDRTVPFKDLPRNS
jgi:alkylation response protein AidB-like acyl-CoA dehydrogenase